MKITLYKDPYLAKIAISSYKKIQGESKPKILTKRMDYFKDGKVTKGAFLDILV